MMAWYRVRPGRIPEARCARGRSNHRSPAPATVALALARAAMADAVISEIGKVRSARIPGVPEKIVNTNTLLGKDGVVGLKTGSTSAAGGALM